VSAPRVLLSGVVLGQPMGGVLRHNLELLPRAARLLAAGGGALHVLAGREPPPAALAAALGAALLPSDVPARPPPLRWLAEGRALAAAIARAREAGTPYDLVHTAHLPVPPRLPLPFVLTVHDLRRLELPDVPRLERAAARVALSAAIRGAARVVTVSETVRAALAARFGVDRLSVVPNAADHLPIAPRRPTADAPLLHVGHLEPRKNLELLLRALALDPALPPLELVGAAKGDARERLADLARRLGVAARVRFAGALPDAELPAAYARAACAVLPSRLEGFGIPALEAQRAGVPLAIADLPALIEVAGAEVPRFDPADPAACARAIRSALATPAEALRASAERAGRFSWDRSAHAWVEAWRLAASDAPEA